MGVAAAPQFLQVCQLLLLLLLLKKVPKRQSLLLLLLGMAVRTAQRVS